MCIRDRYPAGSVTIDVDTFQSILVIVFLDICIYLFPKGSILGRSCVKTAKIERRNQLSPAVSGLFFPFKKIDKLSDKTPLLFPIFLPVNVVFIRFDICLLYTSRCV